MHRHTTLVFMAVLPSVVAAVCDLDSIGNQGLQG